MVVSLVVVNYHSSGSLERMLRTVEGVDEIVIVDHSEDDQELEALKALGADRVVAQPNGGYGAGLNRGVRESRGDTLLLANPDLLLRPGAIRSLVDALEVPGVGIAAPQLVWDEAERWEVPQAPNIGWWNEIEAKYSLWTARRRYFKEQLKLWSATEPTVTSLVSGTLMAVKKESFLAAGGFDPKYFLFYEENDFCLRMRQLGLVPVVAPGARVCHAIGVSADEEAASHFGPSHERFRRLWLPALFTTLWPDPLPPGNSRIRSVDPSRAKDGARWVISPTERFMPVVRGPLVEQADPADVGFLPAPAAHSWVLGIMEDLRVRKVKNEALIADGCSISGSNGGVRRHD